MRRRNLLFRGAGIVMAVLVVTALTGYSFSRWRSEREAVSVEVVPARAGAAQDGDVLTIATYNIAHGRGGRFGASNWEGGSVADKRRRLEEMGALLADLGADVVVLNEVDFSCPWSGHLDQAALIAEAGGYGYIARQRNIDMWLPWFQVRFGNAILSRYPIAEAVLVPFEPLSRVERRLAGNHDSVLARITLPAGRRIAIWAVHLEARAQRTRIAAAQAILGRAAGVAGSLFVVGDLNSVYPRAGVPSAPPTAVSLLLGSGRFMGFPDIRSAERHNTFPSHHPDRIIDWILYPPDWSVVKGGAVRARWSDHLPVAASLVRGKRPGPNQDS